MSITHFTDAVEIEGSQDTTQLKVQGHSSQTEPLQSWEDSAGSPLSHITADGRLLVGDDPGMEAPDALVEAHRDITSVSVPRRALNTLGRVTGALGTAVQWIVHELELRGTGGISGLHTALRSRLIHADTGDSSDSELRAGDFETINQTGTTSERVGKAVALSAAVTNEAGAHLNTAAGVEISLQNGDSGSISEAYGLKINDLDPSTATNSYALHTGSGKVHLGDVLELQVPATAPLPPATGQMVVYPKSNGRLFAKNSSGAEYDLTGEGDYVYLGGLTLPTAGSFNLTGIPQNFQTLIVRGRLRGDANVATVHPNVRLNGDTTASNYVFQRLLAYTAQLEPSLTQELWPGSVVQVYWEPQRRLVLPSLSIRYLVIATQHSSSSGQDSKSV